MEALTEAVLQTCRVCGRSATVLQIDRYPDDVKDPRLAQWYFACADCKPEPAYYVPLDRLLNERFALSWILHLHNKTWFPLSIDSWNRAITLLFPHIEDFA